MFRVLVVDDDEAWCYVAEKLLKGAGYDAVAAADGLAALKVVEDATPLAVLISDIQMRPLHGVALARMARTRHPDVSVILVTGFDVPTGEIDKGTVVLRKPVSDEDLLAAVRTAVGGPSGSPAKR